MKPQNSFSVEFNYALSDTITLKLTASVELKHSLPHYNVSNFHFKNHSSGTSLLPDIDIMAIRRNNEISWIHTDSYKETLLSMAVGKAIEAGKTFEIAEEIE
jgi:hypothetical protein